jgi:hypothetical protein
MYHKLVVSYWNQHFLLDCSHQHFPSKSPIEQNIVEKFQTKLRHYA